MLKIFMNNMVMRRNTPTIRFITLEHDPQKLNQSAAGTVRFTASMLQ